MARQVDLNVVLDVADWLTASGLTVYHEREIRNCPSRDVFSVDEAERGRRPDLLVCGHLVGGGRSFPGSYVAVEVKPGNRHKDILDGFDAVLRYFTDYACGARYLIGSCAVDITAIVLVTSFGPRGHLFKEEAKFDPRGIVHGPWDAYPMTFTVARLLWRQRDNIVKRLRELLLVPGGVASPGSAPPG